MSQFRKLIPFAVASYLIVIAVNLLGNHQYYSHGGNWHYSVAFSLGMTTCCLAFFYVLNGFVFRRMNWTERPTLKVFLGGLIFAAGGSLLSFLAIKGLVLSGIHTEQSVDTYINNCTWSAVLSMAIGFMVTAQMALRGLKEKGEENEQMKQEMIQSQYETLKSQVNPHFLFNSLNTLTVMIPQQPDVAVRFVEQMSKVFRYSLQHSGDNTIDVATELKVVQSYLFLNEQRYGDKLAVAIQVSDAAMQQKIITQSMLMLVENAIKHNELSHEHPLSVKIYNEGAYLVVANTLQRKSLIEKSTNIGLDNIRKRYALATNMPVVVDEANELFTVKIPLL